MSSIKKLAVLSMLAVALIAFCMPASAAIGAGVGASSVSTAGISSASSFSARSAGFGLGGFGLGGFGLGGFGLGWGLGGLGTFGGLGFPFNFAWNQFSPCFGAGSFFSPCFMGSTCQALPFIMGNEGFAAGPGFGITPWAFGLGGCARSMPLFFGAHGFGFPFTLGAWGASLIPPVPVLPACLPAAIPSAIC